MFDFQAIMNSETADEARNEARRQHLAASAVIDALDYKSTKTGIVADVIRAACGDEWLADYERLCALLATLTCQCIAHETAALAELSDLSRDYNS